MGQQVPQQPIAIFGAGALAQLVAYELLSCGSKVVAFCVDPEHIRERTLMGRPVVPLERISDIIAPEAASGLVVVGFQNALRFRERAQQEMLSAGFALTHFISERATVWKGFVPPQNVIVHSGSVIEPFSALGTGVTIRTNVTVGHHVSVGPYSFLASGVTLGGGVTIGARAFLGLGAVVRDGVAVASGSFIAAGSVVTADTRSGMVYAGVPARPLPGKTILDVT